MTSDEKKAQMEQRNAAICAYYSANHTLAETCSRFRLGRQRTQQVLIAGGCWRPYTRSARTKFLGVTVTEETKVALARKAEAQGVSTSKLASDVLDAAVAE